MARRSREDVVFEVLVRLFNTCIGAGFGLLLGMRPRRTRPIRDLLSVDHATALAILCSLGALVGLVWGKKLWAELDRRFHGGWAPRGEPSDIDHDDDEDDKRRKRKTP